MRIAMRSFAACLLLCAMPASAQPAPPAFRIGSVVASATMTGGCPTFDGLLSVLTAQHRHASARAEMIRNHCQPLDPYTRLRVIDLLPQAPIMRVEPPDAPGVDPLFVAEGGFVPVR